MCPEPKKQSLKSISFTVIPYISIWVQRKKLYLSVYNFFRFTLWPQHCYINTKTFTRIDTIRGVAWTFLQGGRGCNVGALLNNMRSGYTIFSNSSNWYFYLHALRSLISCYTGCTKKLSKFEIALYVAKRLKVGNFWVT